jgi:hypothetical protein
MILNKPDMVCGDLLKSSSMMRQSREKATTDVQIAEAVQQFNVVRIEFSVWKPGYPLRERGGSNTFFAEHGWV